MWVDVILRHVNFGSRMWNRFERELFVSGLVSFVFTSFRRAPAAFSSVQSTSHWVAAPLYLGGTFYTEMTGSYKTDQTQLRGIPP